MLHRQLTITIPWHGYAFHITGHWRIPLKKPMMPSLGFSFVGCPKKLLNHKLIRWWFESLWRSSGVTGINVANYVMCLYLVFQCFQYQREYNKLCAVMVMHIIQGCHEVGRKKIPDFSLTFLWLQTELPVTVAIYTLWWFLRYIQNHKKSHYSSIDASTKWSWIEVSTREHFQYYKNCQYLVPNIYAKHENK